MAAPTNASFETWTTPGNPGLNLSGTLPGWTAYSVNGGTVVQGSSLGGFGTYAAKLQSNAAGSTSSIGGITSDAFYLDRTIIKWWSQYQQFHPYVVFTVTLLDASDNILATTTPPLVYPAASQSWDVSAYTGQLVKVRFEQHTTQNVFNWSLWVDNVELDGAVVTPGNYALQTTLQKEYNDSYGLSSTIITPQYSLNSLLQGTMSGTYGLTGNLKAITQGTQALKSKLRQQQPITDALDWEISGTPTVKTSINGAKVISGKLEIIKLFAAIKSPYTVGDIVFDLNKNGLSIFPAPINQLMLPAGEYDNEYTFPSPVIFEENNTLTLDIDSIGSVGAASDITFRAIIRRLPVLAPKIKEIVLAETPIVVGELNKYTTNNSISIQFTQEMSILAPSYIVLTYDDGASESIFGTWTSLELVNDTFVIGAHDYSLKTLGPVKVELIDFIGQNALDLEHNLTQFTLTDNNRISLVALTNYFSTPIIDIDINIPPEHQMRFSMDGATWSTWEGVVRTKSIDITDPIMGGTSSEEEKTVYVQFKNLHQVYSNVYSLKVNYYFSPIPVDFNIFSRLDLPASSQFRVDLVYPNTARLTPLTNISIFDDSTVDSSAYSRVAVMTSNTMPVGFASAHGSSGVAFQAFDSSLSTYYYGSYTVSTPWVAYEFVYPEIIVEYKVLVDSNAQTRPKDFKLQAYDGSTWIDLDVHTNVTDWTSGVYKTYSFSNTTAYKKYRLYITSVFGELYPGYTEARIVDLQLHSNQLSTRTLLLTDAVEALVSGFSVQSIDQPLGITLNSGFAYTTSGKYFTIPGNTSLTFNPLATNADRIDLVYIDTDGTIQILEGTPGNLVTSPPRGVGIYPPIEDGLYARMPDISTDKLPLFGIYIKFNKSCIGDLPNPAWAPLQQRETVEAAYSVDLRQTKLAYNLPALEDGYHYITVALTDAAGRIGTATQGILAFTKLVAPTVKWYTDITLATQITSGSPTSISTPYLKVTPLGGA